MGDHRAASTLVTVPRARPPRVAARDRGRRRPLSRRLARSTARRAVAALRLRHGRRTTREPTRGSRSRRCTPPTISPDGTRRRSSVGPASRRSRAASIRRCTAAGCGRCASTPDSARPQSTNERFNFLLAAGQTGLSCAFDLPTQMGYDSDHPRAEGEVGKVGVAIDSLDDMRTLLDGIPLDQVTTSMTINSTAAILLLMYELVAEEQGVVARSISGTIQNDLLKEYIARGTYVYPPRPSMRIITDIFEYCAEHIPKWNTISISGYHIREAGSTAVQEIAFTLAERDRVRAGGDRRRARRRRLRPAAVVLLERPQPLLRGGRQVPGQPADVAPDHDRAVRRQGPTERRCCGSTPRPVGRRSPRNSRSTMSCGSRSRRWRR